LKHSGPRFAPKRRPLRREFAAAQPFRHVVIDHFVDAAVCDRLIAEFPPFRDSNAVNELGEVGRKAMIPDIARIGAAYAAFDRLMRSKDFLHWLGEVTSVPNLLYDPEYIGGGTHENLSGQDLDWHVDFNYHPHRPLHRRLNLILFLNREWQPEWGGSLELHRDPWNPATNACVRSVVPAANRCVVFETTEASWHGFSRIRAREDGGSRSRRSIAVYFYTNDRPAAETAPPHGTIYVPGPLPRHFEAGYTL